MRKKEDLFKVMEMKDFDVFKKRADCSVFLRVTRDRSGDSLLHRAVDLRLPETCGYLLRKGIRSTCPGCRGATPLHYAAARGDAAIMRLLLKDLRESPLPVNIHGMTPLHVAAGEGHLEIVELLTNQGADLSARDKFDRLPIHFASGADQLAVVRWMVHRDPGLIDLPDAFGQRPIHWAMQFGCHDVAAWLTRRRISLGRRDIYGRSPLFFFRETVESGPLRILLEARLGKAAARGTARKPSALESAIDRGDTIAVKRRLQAARMLDHGDELGRTPLHLAAFARDRELFRWIRKQGGDDGAADDYAWTPLKLLSYRVVRCSRTRPYA